jgi:hypothetical protein
MAGLRSGGLIASSWGTEDSLVKLGDGHEKTDKERDEQDLGRVRGSGIADPGTMAGSMGRGPANAAQLPLAEPPSLGGTQRVGSECLWVPRKELLRFCRGAASAVLELAPTLWGETAVHALSIAL